MDTLLVGTGRHDYREASSDPRSARELGWNTAARAVDTAWNRLEGGRAERPRLRSLFLSPGLRMDGTATARAQARARLLELAGLHGRGSSLLDEVEHFGFDPRDMADCYLRHWIVPGDRSAMPSGMALDVPAGSLCVYSRDLAEWHEARAHRSRIGSYSELGHERFGRDTYRFTFFRTAAGHHEPRPRRPGWGAASLT